MTDNALSLIDDDDTPVAFGVYETLLKEAQEEDDRVIDVNVEGGKVVGRLLRTLSGGSLWAGKAVNHKPAGGRPPSKLRDMMRGDYEIVAQRLRRYVETHPDMKLKDIMAIANHLAKFSVGTKIEHTGPDDSALPPAVIMLPQVDREPEVLVAIEED